MPVRGVKLIGVSKAIAAFKALPALVRQELGTATEDTLIALKSTAQQNVLVDTGRTRDAIDYTFSEKTGVGTVGVRKILFPRGGAQADSAFIAHLIEHGTEKMEAKPFMLPAAEAQRQPYLQRCRAAGAQIEAKASRAAGGVGNL